jgi:KDO2-lipid IV(A) lauroyltransferase
LSRPNWSPGQRWKNDAIYAAARAALALGLTVPRSWLTWLGSAIGSVSLVLFPKARRTALENLELVHPELAPARRSALAREIFRTLGRNLTDTVALLDPTEAPSRTLGITREARDVLDAALAEGRGVVFATCHLGPWERMAALLAALGYPITTLARESYDPRFHGLIYKRLRTARNIETIHRGDPGAPFAIVKALRRGRVLGFLVDLPGSRGATQPVQWLDKPSRVAPGAARLALRTGAPIVVGTPAPGPGGLVLRVTRLGASDLGAGDEAALCQRIADALSERILALPSHWPWMHPSFADLETPCLTGHSGRSAGHFRLVESGRGHLH